MAPRTFHMLLTCLLCLLQTGWCQNGATLMRTTPNPPQLTLTPSESDGYGGRLSIECGASSLGTGEIVSFTNIERRLFTNPNADPVSLAAASALANEGKAQPTSFTPQGANVSGGIGPTDSQKTITLTMGRANCADAGTYYCKAITLDASFAAHTYDSEKNVTIEVSPGNVTSTYDPSGTTNWVVNDILLMRCNGIVGTVKDASQLQWKWQYHSTNGFPWIDNWQDYNSIIGDPDTDINTQSPLPPVSGSCYTRQVSELTRHLTEEDTNRQYRCYVTNGRMSGLAFAQVFTVGTVRQPDVAPATPGISSSSGVPPVTIGTSFGSAPTQTDKSKDDRLKTCDCPDVGVIIGAVVAVLIAIDVVILAVVIIVLKRRMAQSKSRETRGKDNQMFSFGDVNRSVEQRPVEQRPVKQRPVEQRPVEQRPVEQRPVEQRPVEQRPVEQRPVEQRPVEQRPVEQRPVEQRPVEQRPVEQRPVEQRPVEQRPVEQRPVEQRPVEQRPVEQRPVEQRPVEQRPVEQRPVEQRPTAAAENPNHYDGLIMRDVGVASLYQDLGSPYELLR